MTIPTMLKVLFSWLAADRLEGGDRLQPPSRSPCGDLGLSLDAKAEDGRAWVGGFLEIVPGCQGPWFSLTIGGGPLGHSPSPAPTKLLRRTPGNPDRREALDPGLRG